MKQSLRNARAWQWAACQSYELYRDAAYHVRSKDGKSQLIRSKRARGYWGDVAMRSVLFLVGLVLGFLGGVGTIIYLQQRNKDTGEMSIVFAQKNYYETPAVVTVSGTLTGEGLGYPNNTYSIACFQDRKECWMTSVEAIGGLQIGRMDSPYAYDIRK